MEASDLDSLIYFFLFVCVSVWFCVLSRALIVWQLKRRYQKECQQFEEALARGEVPEHAPIEYFYDGGIVCRVEPRYLLRCGRVRRQLDACRAFMADARDRNIQID